MKNTDVVYVDPKDLLQDLEIASHGLSTREMIEQGQCFRIKGKSIVTFNDEITCSIANCIYPSTSPTWYATENRRGENNNFITG